MTRSSGLARWQVGLILGLVLVAAASAYLLQPRGGILNNVSGGGLRPAQLPVQVEVHAPKWTYSP